MQQTNDDEPLATLVHISDLHFGNKFTADERVLKRLLAMLPYVQGVCGHSYQATRALAFRINQIVRNRKERKIPVSVVFTGDLTRSGEEAEFVVGSTFLRNAHSTGAGRNVGLKLREPQEELKRGSEPALFAIPGNHDIWKRRRPDMIGAYRRFFPGGFPVICRIETRSRPILLCGLDSTQNTEMRHRLARGRIPPDELDFLCEHLPSAQYADAIKIICLHHPLGDPPDKTYNVSMRLEHREAIAQRFLTSGADLVLAGHIHEFHVFPKTNHAVAGTATQQFSERNFLLLDVYEREIQLLPFDFDIRSLQFLPTVEKRHIFSIPGPSRSTSSPRLSVGQNGTIVRANGKTIFSG